LQPRDSRIEPPITGLIATNKRAAVQGSSSALRPRPRLYCFSPFRCPPPTVLLSRLFSLSSRDLTFLIFSRVHHAPGRVVMNASRHDPSTETPPVSSIRIEFPVTSRTRHLGQIALQVLRQHTDPAPAASAPLFFKYLVLPGTYKPGPSPWTAVARPEKMDFHRPSLRRLSGGVYQWRRTCTISTS
jgi:hypothetical protein